MTIARAAMGRGLCRFHIRRREWPRGSSRLQEKKGPREGEGKGKGEGGKFSLKYKGNISTPLDGEFA